MSNENAILDSWHQNANNWIRIIAEEGIESRKLATNAAIVQAVLNLRPQYVLDIGCGEGWLTQQLAANGINVAGVDAIPELVAHAAANTKGDFRVATYEELAAGKVVFENLFDCMVVNFALIGKESTAHLLAALPALLTREGTLLIQTLHPFSRKALGDYTTGWKNGSWDGLGGQFTHAYQWYFRTLEDWLALLDETGWVTSVQEVVHPQSGAPLSVIFACQKKV